MAVRLRIIVQKNDVGGGSRADSTVHGSGKPGVAVQENGRDIMFLKPFHASVRGTVVHHQDLEIPAYLKLQRLKTRLHESQPVVIRYDDGRLLMVPLRVVYGAAHINSSGANCS